MRKAVKAKRHDPSSALTKSEVFHVAEVLKGWGTATSTKTLAECEEAFTMFGDVLHVKLEEGASEQVYTKLQEMLSTSETVFS